MSKKLTFEIDFEVDASSIKNVASGVRKEFSGKLAQDINTVTIELNRQIDVLELYRKKGEITSDELVKGYQDIERQLNQLPIATKSVIQAQSRLVDSQNRLNASSAKFNTGLKGTNNTLMNFGRVIQDAPFGIMGVANNIDPLVDSFQRLGKEAGGSRNAFKALLSGLTGPAGLAIGISAITSLMIAYGDDILEFFIKPTEDATKVAEEYTNAISNIAKELSKASGAGDIESITNELKLLELQQAELAKQAENTPSFFDRFFGVSSGNIAVAVDSFVALGKEGNTIDEINEKISARRLELQAKLNALKRVENSQSAQSAKAQAEALEIQNKADKIGISGVPDLGFTLTTEEDAEKLAQFKSFIDSQADYLRDVNKQLLDEDKARANEAISLEQYKQDAILSIRQNAFDFSTNLVGALEGFGLISAKKAFGINKALGIADATINTYKGVTAALSQPLPPPLPQIDAGIRLANGLAQVAKIASTKFNPNGGGGASSGGGAVNVPNPNIVRPTFTAPSSTLSQQNEDRLKSSNATVILNVENRMDRQGLALAVREGSDELNARSVTIKSV